MGQKKKKNTASYCCRGNNPCCASPLYQAIEVIAVCHNQSPVQSTGSVQLTPPTQDAIEVHVEQLGGLRGAVVDRLDGQYHLGLTSREDSGPVGHQKILQSQSVVCISDRPGNQQAGYCPDSPLDGQVCSGVAVSVDDNLAGGGEADQTPRIAALQYRHGNCGGWVEDAVGGRVEEVDGEV